MFDPSRDEARRFLIGAWTKFRAREPLSTLERMAAELIALHPEYHPIVEAPERNLDRDWKPEGGEANPFNASEVSPRPGQPVAGGQRAVERPSRIRPRAC